MYIPNLKHKVSYKRTTSIKTHIASNIIVKLFFSLALFSSLFSISSSSTTSSSSIDWWCNQTPYPEPCKYHMNHRHNRFKPNHRSEFRKILVQLAVEQAQAMHKEAQEYGPKIVSQTQTYVFSDCLKLYDNTVFHLNQTLQALHSYACSLLDAQTWLSTALSNIETCCSSAVQLGVRVFSLQNNVSSHNVRKMISNVLAVNGEILKQENNNTKRKALGFIPSWFSWHERRLLSLSSSSLKANLVVAQDGTGHFKTVRAAIDATSKRTVKARFVIRVKKGVYEENIQVDKNNENLMIVGDGMKLTIIIGSKSVQDGITPSMSATVGIDGAHFIARDITFRNTAGPEKGQVLALQSASDLSVFYQCSIEGYQDTLMAHAQRQFYRDCSIFGTVDFIWGDAAIVLQNCTILVRKPLQGQGNMITAQGRGDPFQNTGISIINSRIRAAPDLRPVVKSYETYLGGPWQQYARVVAMKTYIEGLVNPLGWSQWGDSDFAQDTCYFGEYMNSGTGSSTKDRVQWPGFHVLTSENDTQQFSVAGLLAGNTWLPPTGVPFDIDI
ncbi:pectinesterase-like [Neltuma alba]|uniref:pectinesterase-like n=1 Tax=Neltuma alba TaxID=207710 RepID=UPI0010A4AEF1|nr:pectinesterase-like [Prosopis alba]